MQCIHHIHCPFHPQFVTSKRNLLRVALLVAVGFALSTAEPGRHAAASLVPSKGIVLLERGRADAPPAHYTENETAFSPTSGTPFSWAGVMIWSLAGFWAGMTAFHFLCPAYRKTATQYGEVKTVYLPDHSEVTLNANSRIRFARRWKKGRLREVWLEGEAYFNVRPLHHANAGFVVHTRGLDVEAPGASFNVKDRRDKTVVTLSHGQACLYQAPGMQHETRLRGGEKAVYHLHDRRMLHSSSHDAVCSSWRHQLLVLDGLTVREIAELLEDHYGITVTIGDDALAGHKLRGRFIAGNLQEVMGVLQNALRVGVAQSEKTTGSI